MDRKVVDCPDTEKRETIELERTPLGSVVANCSRFGVGCALRCSARCAAIFDARDRRDVDDLEPRILVVYAEGCEQIARALAAQLKLDRLTVEVAAASGAPPPAADYDAVVIGSNVHRGRHPRSIVEYLAYNGDALATMPAFLFAVGNESRAVGAWRPSLATTFDASSSAFAVREFAQAIAEQVPSPMLVTMLPARKHTTTK